MPDYERSKLREHYHSLSEIKSVFNDAANRTHAILENGLVAEYERFINQATADLPNLLVPFRKQDYHSHDTYYRGEGIQAHIGRNLGILKTKLDEDEQNPVTESKSFHFINESELRAIIERDYQEIQRSIIAKNWKSAIILSGGVIEAILLDVVTKNESTAKSSSKAPDQSDLNKWDLNDLINVVVDANLVGSEVATLSHSVRKYRNLIHPGVELRTGQKVEPEEANIALNVLNILIRELS